MDEKNESNSKPKQKRGIIFFFGLIWIALGLFGLIFDPSRELIIAVQFIIGIGILVFYFSRRSKQ